MTNDQFKVLLYGTALLGVFFVEGKGGTSEKHSSLAANSYPKAPYEWSQATNQRFKPQDSPWLWLDSRTHTQQVVQKDSTKNKGISADAQKPQVQPVREEDRVSSETSSTDGIESMEKLRQFRLERQNEKVMIIHM